MSIGVSAADSAAFDAGREVPDEYDVFCEGCSYSLVGLTGDRCPECGREFEPKQLPFTRVPWLHRRRLGRVRAYVKTVGFVCLRPRRFAEELCRPVRISGNDARSFRLVTLWLATAGVVVAMLVVPLTAAQWMFTRGGTFATMPIRLAAYLALLPLVWGLGFHLAVRMATDMPLFIWKGLPSVSPTELSPIHQYACAPLAFFPVLAVTLGGAGYVMAMSPFPIDFTLLGIAMSVVGGVLFVWLWAVALVFLRVSTGAGTRRVLALALYLPVHWVMMSFLGFVCGGVLLAAASAILGRPYR